MVPRFTESSSPTRRLACTGALALLVTIVALGSLAGCRHEYHGEAVVRPEFLTYDRVAIFCSQITITRDTEDLFIPVYMDAFPSQLLVERRDVSAVIGEQDLLPERLDEATRAKLRKILGVKAIVFARGSNDTFAIKVIETSSGAITASVFIDGNDPKVKGGIPPKQMVRQAIAALKKAADAQGGAHLPDAVVPPPTAPLPEPHVQPQTQPQTEAQPKPLPVHPPPRD